MPLPQAVGVQLASQPSPFIRFPSSQSLRRPPTAPLPQALAVQLASQPSPLDALPSSQVSPEP
jgi:hypothetical protein